MKIRTTFVSNSSTSSFVILKKYLTPLQIEQIKDHAKLGQEMGMSWAESDPWTIREDNEFIAGETWMDNFDMSSFLKQIGVPIDKVEWDESIPGLMLDEIIGPMLKNNDYIETLVADMEDFKKTEEGRQTELVSKGTAWWVFDQFVDWLKKTK